MHATGHHSWHDHTIAARVGIVLGSIAVAAGFFLLGGWVVVWLWNWLMPVIFHIPTIGFWQAWGLLVLSTIFFKRMPSAAHASRERRRKLALRQKLRDFSDESHHGGHGYGDAAVSPEDEVH